MDPVGWVESRDREVRVRKRNRERGFTLIELLVVIAIIAVLFGVTALALSGVFNRDSVERDTAEAEMDAVQTAIDVYIAKSGNTTVDEPDEREQVGPHTEGFGDYLRRTSKFYYDWNDSGTITGVYDSENGQLWPER